MKIGAFRLGNDLIVEDMDCQPAEFEAMILALVKVHDLVRAATPSRPYSSSPTEGAHT